MMTAFSATEVPAGRIVARVGLLSDTHMPERCVALPEAIFDLFRGVDLILHAGDVGELWVLDRLSGVAPVVAVHGNDDSRAAQRELPYQQVVAVAGLRLLLWHSHYPDPAEDRANRSDAWGPILARQAERGRRAGAGVVVYGHTHVPMARRYGGRLLINPGALASGNLWTRQARQTVAVLSIGADGLLSVSHVDLAAPGRVFDPEIDWGAGFKAAGGRFQLSIVEPALAGVIDQLFTQTFDDGGAIRDVILPLSRACWAGAKPYVTRAELLDAIKQDGRIPASDKAKLASTILGE